MRRGCAPGLLFICLWAAPALAADVEVELAPGDGFVIENAGGAVERLRVDEATGNISRNGALFVHTTPGLAGTFVGASAGNPAMTGTDNSALGANALRDNATGQSNTAIGAHSLLDNVDGSLNTAVGQSALRFNTTGARNSAFGVSALRSSTTANDNSAFGHYALFTNTEGQNNAAFGESALRSNTLASFNSAFGRGALFANTSGTYNSAFGTEALRSNVSDGNQSAFGFRALHESTTGGANSAFGSKALYENTTGSNNAGFGAYALRDSTGGDRNSAFGTSALRATTASASSAFGDGSLLNATGGPNQAFGADSLRNVTTGTNNTAIGFGAGIDQTTGSQNVYVDNAGVAGESGVIKIGNASHTQTFIEGIDGNTAVAGVAVLVNANSELHTLVSSARFKQDVRDMGSSSELLHGLRPVTFRYREHAEAGSTDVEYGLIAEEVAEVAPELVVRDAAGRPYAVRYHVLAPLLINELQRQRASADARIEALLARVRALESALRRDGGAAAR